MVFLSPGLKGIVLEIIHPTKCPNCEALKLFPFFFPTSQDSKDQAVELILLESANTCWRLRIFMVIWAGTSHATNQSLSKSVPPRGCVCPRDEGPSCQSCMCRAQCKALVEELRVSQALCCADAVKDFSCWSFTLVRTNLSTDYPPLCKPSAADKRFFRVPLHTSAWYYNINQRNHHHVRHSKNISSAGCEWISSFIFSCIHYSNFLERFVHF